jgi:hypothetical protein
VFWRTFDLLEHIALQIRSDVGQENVFGIAEFLGELGPEFSEDVQFSDERFTLVQVLRIFSGPEKTFAVSAFQAGSVNFAVLENAGIGGREIVAYDTDEIYVGEEAGGYGEICGRAADDAINLSVGAFDRVKRYGTYDE